MLSLLAVCGLELGSERVFVPGLTPGSDRGQVFLVKFLGPITKVKEDLNVVSVKAKDHEQTRKNFLSRLPDMEKIANNSWRLASYESRDESP